MSASQFDAKLYIDKDGDLMVAGPFDPEGGRILGTAKIHFLIIQDREGLRSGREARRGAREARGSARDAPRDDVVIENEAAWTPPRRRWHKKIPADDLRGLQPGDARGIGIAVVIKKGSDGNPPIFETITWCADTKIVKRRARGA
jgi:hypothetical protein